MLYIILPVVGLLVFLTHILMNTHKTYVVKCEGLVQAVNKRNIASPVTGELLQRYMEEGQTVQEGDLLAVIRHNDFAQSNDLAAQEKQLTSKSRPSQTA